MNLNGKIISFLGDSITQGVGTSANEMRYTDLIAEKYSVKKMNNYGISGTRFAKQINTPSEFSTFDMDFCMRAPLINKDSDVIVVFGGTNDYGHGDAPFGVPGDTEPHTFCGACDFLMNILKNEFPNAVKVICTPMHRSTEDVKDRKGKVLCDYVKVIKNIAEKYGFYVCDLYSDLKINPKMPKDMEDYCPDGLHPNDAGNRILADYLGKFLENI